MTCKNNNEKEHDLMIKVCLKWLPSAAMQSCAVPLLQCQSLADQDRLTLIRAATAVNSTSLIPDSFKCGLAEYPIPHSRWALDMDRLLDGHRECGINFRRLRLPVLDVLGPFPAGK